ncbi:hypothetical protein EV207_1383 [Scopulibacillus darangshiensis]|uniref:Uncharacterized protein n=1 Tax=Scopulibacillus darangshiensis TaxID=442528 RepID=A0A4R2NKQ5_9BACL|nr:hypothetical protein [Scopulibacillus darangshiensis]TCP21918.1 hypothetical protein EV207_1383 [Scopulibacillus darangshiensis]
MEYIVILCIAVPFWFIFRSIRKEITEINKTLIQIRNQNDYKFEVKDIKKAEITNDSSDSQSHLEDKDIEQK